MRRAVYSRGGAFSRRRISGAPIDRGAEILRARAIDEYFLVGDRLGSEARLRERAQERLLRLEMELGDAVAAPHPELGADREALRSIEVDVELHVALDARRHRAETRVDRVVALEVALVREARIAAHQVLVTDRGAQLRLDEHH